MTSAIKSDVIHHTFHKKKDILSSSHQIATMRRIAFFFGSTLVLTHGFIPNNSHNRSPPTLLHAEEKYRKVIQGLFLELKDDQKTEILTELQLLLEQSKEEERIESEVVSISSVPSPATTTSNDADDDDEWERVARFMSGYWSSTKETEEKPYFVSLTDDKEEDVRDTIQESSSTISQSLDDEEDNDESDSNTAESIDETVNVAYDTVETDNDEVDEELIEESSSTISEEDKGGISGDSGNESMSIDEEKEEDSGIFGQLKNLFSFGAVKDDKTTETDVPSEDEKQSQAPTKVSKRSFPQVRTFSGFDGPSRGTAPPTVDENNLLDTETQEIIDIEEPQLSEQAEEDDTSDSYEGNVIAEEVVSETKEVEDTSETELVKHGVDEEESEIKEGNAETDEETIGTASQTEIDNRFEDRGENTTFQVKVDEEDKAEEAMQEIFKSIALEEKLPVADSSFEESVITSKFPSALDNSKLTARVAEILGKRGIDGNNTLLATSLCCDELARQLPRDFRRVSSFGPSFNLGGLSGFPFGGKTAFGAMAAHIPDDGYALLVYGPHVGITQDGTVGKVERTGIKLVDNCCGSALAADRFVQSISDGGMKIQTEIESFEDFQQRAVQKLLLPYGARLQQSQSRMTELPQCLFEAQDALVQDIVRSGINATKSGIVILGGIQVNTGPDTPDYFAPLRFQLLQRDATIELLGELTATANESYTSSESGVEEGFVDIGERVKNFMNGYWGDIELESTKEETKKEESNDFDTDEEAETDSTDDNETIETVSVSKETPSLSQAALDSSESATSFMNSYWTSPPSLSDNTDVASEDEFTEKLTSTQEDDYVSASIDETDAYDSEPDEEEEPMWSSSDQQVEGEPVVLEQNDPRLSDESEPIEESSAIYTEIESQMDTSTVEDRNDSLQDESDWNYSEEGSMTMPSRSSGRLPRGFIDVEFDNKSDVENSFSRGRLDQGSRFPSYGRESRGFETKAIESMSVDDREVSTQDAGESILQPFGNPSPPSDSSALVTVNDDNSKTKALVPCFGAAPMLGGPIFFGENYWNKLTSEYGDENTGVFIRAAELKHGRIAMLATVGFAFQKFGITANTISPFQYLSRSQDIKFVDLVEAGPLKSVQMIPTLYLVFILGAVASIELFELFFMKESTKGEDGFSSGRLTGDLGFNPLFVRVTDRRRLVELQNGRAAMFAITAWIAAEAVPGSVPLILPW